MQLHSTHLDCKYLAYCIMNRAIELKKKVYILELFNAVIAIKGY